MKVVVVILAKVILAKFPIVEYVGFAQGFVVKVREGFCSPKGLLRILVPCLFNLMIDLFKIFLELLFVWFHVIPSFRLDDVGPCKLGGRATHWHKSGMKEQEKFIGSRESQTE